MILYNETIKIEEGLQEEWLEWMRQEQLPAILATGKVSEHRICRLLHDDEDGGVTYAVQYFLPDLDTFRRYQQEDAPHFQRRQMERYRDRYVAFRTLMEIV